MQCRQGPSSYVAVPAVGRARSLHSSPRPRAMRCQPTEATSERRGCSPHRPPDRTRRHQEPYPRWLPRFGPRRRALLAFVPRSSKTYLPLPMCETRSVDRVIPRIHCPIARTCSAGASAPAPSGQEHDRERNSSITGIEDDSCRSGRNAGCWPAPSAHPSARGGFWPGRQSSLCGRHRSWKISGQMCTSRVGSARAISSAACPPPPTAITMNCRPLCM